MFNIILQCHRILLDQLELQSQSTEIVSHRKGHPWGQSDQR